MLQKCGGEALSFGEFAVKSNASGELAEFSGFTTASGVGLFVQSQKFSVALGERIYSPDCKHVRSWRMASSLAFGESSRCPRNSCVVWRKRSSAFRRDATTARISEWDCAPDELERNDGGGAAGVATGKASAKTTARNAIARRIECFIEFSPRLEPWLGLPRSKRPVIQPPGLGTH